MLIIIIMPIVSKEILEFLFGEKYGNANMCLSILLLFTGLFFVRELYGYTLMAWGKQKKYMNTVMISSMINIILNLILIPVMGINGAALATLVSEIINIIMMRKYVINEYKIIYENNYLIKILSISIFVAIIVYFMSKLNFNILIIGILTSSIYFLGIFITKVIDVSNIKNKLHKRR